jgi:cobalt-zinc-cadmium efflux system protein
VARTTRLTVVLLLNLALVAGLVVAGTGAHSVAVLAAGGDYLADAAAIGVSLLAIGLARRAPTRRRPGGFPRATAYAALINVTALLAVMAVVAAGAAGRLVSGAGHVHGLPVLIASGAAALVMLGAGLILRGDDGAPGDTAGDRANMRAVLLDTLADGAAAAGVAAPGRSSWPTRSFPPGWIPRHRPGYRRCSFTMSPAAAARLGSRTASSSPSRYMRLSHPCATSRTGR